MSGSRPLTANPELGSVAARLAHDLGKHLTRGACNVRKDEHVPAAVAALIVGDLYTLASGRRASLRFAELAAPLLAALSDPRLERAAQLLSEIDALEVGVRAGDQRALHCAAERALEVEALLSSLAGELVGDTP